VETAAVRAAVLSCVPLEVATVRAPAPLALQAQSSEPTKNLNYDSRCWARPSMRPGSLGGQRSS
jgi:hypothetical protein